ncbi:hypothetical protein D3C87_2061070 [compost metagenome]
MAPLDEDPFQCVGIIAGPEFSEIFHGAIIRAAATAGAEHDGNCGIFGADTVEHLV